MRNALFYWGEKSSETAFVLRELKHIPVRRGCATVIVKLGGIKIIELR